MSQAQSEIRRHVEYDMHRSKVITLHTLQCFLGMLETGEAVIGDFVGIGLGFDLEQVARGFGERNGWTGTSGETARKVMEFIKCK